MISVLAAIAFEWSAYVGQAAGIGTSLGWTGTSLFFSEAGRRIGTTNVNAYRLVLAVIFCGVTHRMMFGAWWPDATGGQVTFLAASGLIGLTIGDQALFTAFVDIGPRLSTLIMTTSPLFAALFGWIVLDEKLTGIALIGMAVTMGGIAWVVMEKPASTMKPKSPLYARGILWAFVGAACQAGGMLLSKQGIGHGMANVDVRMNPQAATFVRMIFALLGMVPVLGIYWYREQRRRRAGRMPDRSGSVAAGYLFATGGAVVGPYLGVWLSLIAVNNAPVGVAQTLCSLSPVFVLPFVRFFYNEHVSMRAVLGAFVAVGGVTVLIFEEPLLRILYDATPAITSGG